MSYKIATNSMGQLHETKLTCTLPYAYTEMK